MPERTDKELLELAAKAAGIPRQQWDYEFCRSLGHMVTQSMMWNPLTDDGDALRLAVKLAIGVQSLEGLGHSIAMAELLQKSIRVREDHSGSSPGEATRLAIVRAAAEIGANMQS